MNSFNPFTGGYFWDLLKRNVTGPDAAALARNMDRLHSTPLISVFDDYLFSGLSLGRGASAPDLAELRDGLFLLAFAGTGVTVERGFFTMHVLHGLKPGSTPTMHLHWTHNNAAPSGNVKWMVDYTVATGYQTAQYGAPTTITSTQAADSQYTHHITDDDDMPLPSTMEPDSVLIGRVYRDPADAADTFEDDAFLIHIDTHYERDRVGSTTRNRPFDGFPV